MNCLLPNKIIDLSQTYSSHYCSAGPSELNWPAANDDHEAPDLPVLPEIDLGNLLDPFADPLELQTNPPALENVGSTPLDRTSVRENNLSKTYFNAQTAIGETQREVWELRLLRAADRYAYVDCESTA
jgi:hypothetical protein